MFPTSATPALTRLFKRFRLFYVFALIMAPLAALYLTTGAVKSKEVKKTLDAKPSLNLGKRQQLPVEYRGDAAIVAALVNGEARPLTLSTVDFDLDGAPDLATGYAWGNRGIVTLQRGNPDAFVPKDAEIFHNAAKGILPPSFVPTADVFDLQGAPDFLLAGDFNADGYPDLLTAARGGAALELLAGNGQGAVAGQEQLTLDGTVSAVTSGAFSHPQGTTMSVIVGINGSAGPEARVYAATKEKFLGDAVASYPLPTAASALQIGLLDEDPYFDLAVAADYQIVIVHGHEIPKPGREVVFDAQSRLEQVRLSGAVKGLAVGNFILDREGRSELALLSDSGAIKFLQRGQLAPVAEPVQLSETPSLALIRKRSVDELKAKARVPEWRSAKQPWGESSVPEISVAGPGTAAEHLKISRIPAGATDELLLVDQTSGQVKSLNAQREGKVTTLTQEAAAAERVAPSSIDNLTVAALIMPQKVNGERDLIKLGAKKTDEIIGPNAATTFTVNTTLDLFRGTATQCNGAGGDCSLREAVIKANTISAPFAGPGHTINVPSGTYNLSINNPNTPATTGTINFPDLQIGSDINRNTTLIGTGVTRPIINQTIAGNDVITTGFNASTVPVAVNLSLQNLEVQGGTFTGIFTGVDNATGISTSLMNNCNIHNNAAINGTFGQGGGIQNAIGHLTVTNSTMASNSAPSTTFGQGGAIAHIVLNPSGTGSTGNLLVDNTVFSANSASVAAGFPCGAGIFSTVANAANSAVITDSTFTTNTCANGHGAGIATSSNNTTTANRNRFRGNTVGGTGTGTAMRSNGSGPINAENNWWGCDAFPTAAPCDTATVAGGSGAIDSDPRIDLKLTASPATICRGATSTITADVRQNTANVNVNAGNAPDVLVGLTLTFANGNLGTVTPPLTGVIPVGGTVAKTFTAPAVHGTANPTVLLDVGTPQAVPILIPNSFTSVQTGNFNVATTWTPQCVPQSDDSVTIANTHTVSLPSDQNIADVTINAGGTLNTSTFNLNVNSTNLITADNPTGKNYAAVNSWTNNGSLSGTGTITFNGANVQQTIGGTTTFNNLTVNHTGTGTVNATGSTLNVNALSLVQAGTLIGGNQLNNVTINAGATLQSVAAGTINVAGTWTNGGTFTHSGGTVVFNGVTQAIAGTATTAFNNLTINNGSTTTANTAPTVAATFTIQNGGKYNHTTATGIPGVTRTFGATSTYEVQNSGMTFANVTFGNLTINFAGAGVLSAAGNLQTVVGTLRIQSTGTGSFGLASTTSPTVNLGGILMDAGTFNFSTGVGAPIVNVIGATGNVQLNGGTLQPQTSTGVPVFNIAGNWTRVGTTFTPGLGTVTFNGNNNTQTITGNTTFNNLTINHTGTNSVVTAVGTSPTVTALMRVQAGTFTTAASTFNNVQIDLNAILAGTNATTMNVSGTWTNNGGAAGSFTANGNTVNFNGSVPQTISGTTFTTFNNLTIANAVGGVSLGQTANVNGVLTLTNDLTTGANILIMPATGTSAGGADVIGNVRRTGFTGGGPALSFGNPFNSIGFIAQGTLPTDVTVNLVKATPTGPPAFPTAVQRTYTITPTGGAGYSATLRLHYLDTELNTNVEADLGLWRLLGGAWARQGRTGSVDIVNNWAELSGVTQFSPWTLGSAKNDTTTTITSDNPEPSNIGQVVTVNYTVTSNVAGAPPVTGDVTITVNDASGDTCTGTVAAGTCALTLTTAGSKTLMATYSSDVNFNGSSDTEAHVVAIPDINVLDGSAPEPASGSTNLLFTVALSMPAPTAVSVNFQTANGGANPATAGTCGAGGDYVATSGTVNFAVGQQLQTIAVPICADGAVEIDETFLLDLSMPVNGAIVDGQAVGTITTTNTPGTLLISEVRTSGPGGTADEFVEIYNNTDSPLIIAASDASAGYGLFKMGGTCADTPVLIGTIPNGTNIPARGHYLFAGSAYSLADYGGTGAAAGDLTLSADIENDGNVGIFTTANLGNISSQNRRDAVGFGGNTGGNCDLLREPANLGAASGSTSEYSFVRKLATGTPQDTNDNSVDFALVSTTPATPVGTNAEPTLGGAGPENLASPIQRSAVIKASLLDPTVGSSVSPNRFRDTTPGPPATSNLGTLVFRRKFTNTTAGQVTRLRFRIVDITGVPVPPGTADLRAITSTSTMVTGPSIGTVTVQGTTLEEPPAQPNGGGLNSTLSAGTVTLMSPLGPGAPINLQFLLGVQQGGSFRFFIVVEALP